MLAETCPLILPIHRDLDALREDASAARARSAPPGAASARPMRTRSGAARSASATSPISANSSPLLDRLCAHHDALRAGFGEPPVDRERLRHDLAEIADFVLPFARPVWRDLDDAAARRQQDPVRRRAGRAARRRPRHLSVRHFFEHRRRDDRIGQRHGPFGRGLRAGDRQGLHHARRARAPSRPSSTTRSASGSASAATSSAPSPAASAAAAGSTRCWCARRSRSAA